MKFDFGISETRAVLEGKPLYYQVFLVAIAGGIWSWVIYKLLF